MKRILFIFFLFCSAKIFSQVPQLSLYEFVNGLAIPKATSSTYKLNKIGSIFYNTEDSSLSYNTGTQLLKPARHYGEIFGYLNNQIDLKAEVNNKVDVHKVYAFPLWLTRIDTSIVAGLLELYKDYWKTRHVVIGGTTYNQMVIGLETEDTLLVPDVGLWMPSRHFALGYRNRIIFTNNADQDDGIGIDRNINDLYIRSGDSAYHGATRFGNNFIQIQDLSLVPATVKKANRATTIDVGRANTVACNDDSTTLVTTITGGINGLPVIFRFNTANTVIQNNSTIALTEGVDYRSVANSGIILQNNGSKWVQISPGSASILGSGGSVSSVANSDGTLTISPTSGSVIASLNPAHANTWTAKQTIQLATAQLRLGFDVSNYTDFAVASDGKLTITPSGTAVTIPTTSNFLALGGIQTSNTGTNSNLYVGSASSAITTTTASYLFAGSSTVGYRRGFRGSTNYTVGANNSYAGTIFGQEAVTIAASGTHASFTTALFRAPSITSGIGILTSASTIRIEEAPTGALTNWALNIVSGNTNLGGIAKYSANFGSLYDARTLIDRNYGDSSYIKNQFASKQTAKAWFDTLKVDYALVGSLSSNFAEIQNSAINIGTSASYSKVQNNRFVTKATDFSLGTMDAGFSTFNTLMYFNNTGSIGVGTASPNSTAALDIVSTTKGLAPPRMTTTQRNAISSPLEGLMVYDLTLHKLYVYDGTIWQAAW